MNTFLRTLLKNITVCAALVACSFFFLLAPSYAAPEGVSPSLASPNNMLAIASGMVERGDKIIFSRDALNTEDNVESIQWQQDFKQRKANYIVVDSAIENTNVSVPLFVQKSLAQNLLNKCQAKENECTAIVDENFQYGQDNEKTFRFLVYHNKSYRPYQHRFINTSTASKIASWSKAKAGSKNLKVLDRAVSKAQAVFGDYLRDFSADS